MVNKQSGMVNKVTLKGALADHSTLMPRGLLRYIRSRAPQAVRPFRLIGDVFTEGASETRAYVDGMEVYLHVVKTRGFAAEAFFGETIDGAVRTQEQVVNSVVERMDQTVRELTSAFASTTVVFAAPEQLPQPQPQQHQQQQPQRRRRRHGQRQRQPQAQPQQPQPQQPQQRSCFVSSQLNDAVRLFIRGQREMAFLVANKAYRLPRPFLLAVIEGFRRLFATREDTRWQVHDAAGRADDYICQQTWYPFQSAVVSSKLEYLVFGSPLALITPFVGERALIRREGLLAALDISWEEMALVVSIAGTSRISGIPGYGITKAVRELEKIRALWEEEAHPAISYARFLLSMLEVGADICSPVINRLVGEGADAFEERRALLLAENAAIRGRCCAEVEALHIAIRDATVFSGELELPLWDGVVGVRRFLAEGRRPKLEDRWILMEAHRQQQQQVQVQHARMSPHERWRGRQRNKRERQELRGVRTTRVSHHFTVQLMTHEEAQAAVVAYHRRQ